MSSNVSKHEQESDSYQYEHAMVTKCSLSRVRAKVVFKGPVSSVESEDTKLTDAGRKEKGKEAREPGRKEKVDPKERDGPKDNGQTLVTRGTILGIIPSGTAKRTVLRWIRGLLLNLFLISVESVCTQLRGVF